MAMSSSVVTAGSAGNPQFKRWNVVATADADSGTLVIAHGMGAAPTHVSLVALLGAAVLSQWSVAWDATNITLTKNSTGAGSGNAGAQLQVSAFLVHSIQQ